MKKFAGELKITQPIKKKAHGKQSEPKATGIAKGKGFPKKQDKGKP